MAHFCVAGSVALTVLALLRSRIVALVHTFHRGGSAGGAGRATIESGPQSAVPPEQGKLGEQVSKKFESLFLLLALRLKSTLFLGRRRS